MIDNKMSETMNELPARVLSAEKAHTSYIDALRAANKLANGKILRLLGL